MALRRRGGGDGGLNVWPGYVDALSTLLMVIIFVLLVFVLAQAFLSVALNGRTQEMEKLAQQLATLQAAQTRLVDERATLTGERERLSALLADEMVQTRAAQVRAGELTAQLAELDRARQADRAALTARELDLARLAEQLRALMALRDAAEQQARDAAARASTAAEAHDAAAAQAAEARQLADNARAQLALTSRELEELRAQVAAVQKALEAAAVATRDKDAQIASLGSQLNAALARQVEELQRYRSEFFGRLRTVLANRPGIQVVGDRFVFQSEVLFPVGRAELTAAGAEEIQKLSETLIQVSRDIPANIGWILRVDGHADRQPIERGRWASNWELSAARAITVVKLLIYHGVPPERLAATGFADNQPLDVADTPEAYARNRRIEIRLTDR